MSHDSHIMTGHYVITALSTININNDDADLSTNILIIILMFGNRELKRPFRKPIDHWLTH